MPPAPVLSPECRGGGVAAMSDEGPHALIDVEILEDCKVDTGGQIEQLRAGESRALPAPRALALVNPAEGRPQARLKLRGPQDAAGWERR